ncbi:MAG: hypothetical protein PHS96_03340 [Anaerolineales bacterium]|nr:hypothetical protein [Anaerolineales bacterium]
MTSANYDLAYVQAGVASLEAYLLSGELYWPLDAAPLPGEPPYPRLTLGGLLLAVRRASGRRLSPAEVTLLRESEHELEATRRRWAAAWQGKARREFTSRLRLWRDYLNDYRENPQEHLDRYAYEARRRVMLELLLPETGETPAAELELLGALDRVLHGVFAQDGFIWEAELAPAFPEAPYWYLWGTPKKGL